MKRKILITILIGVTIISILFLVGFIAKIESNKNVGLDHVCPEFDWKKNYNFMIEKYIGEIKKGTEVKAMIEDVITRNNSYVGESRGFTSIKIVEGEELSHLKNAKGEEDLMGEALAKACDRANFFKGGENTQENIDVAKKEMRKLYNAISLNGDEKIYSVLTEDGDENGITDGVIHTVYIKEVNSKSMNKKSTK